MEFADLKKAYQILQKKYQLPEFKDIHQEFELQHIEDEEFLLRSVRRRIQTKILFFASILESILYPSGQSPSSSYESGFFSSDDKQDLSKVYKKLMILSRKHVRLDVASTEKEDALFIKEAFFVAVAWKSMHSFPCSCCLYKPQEKSLRFTFVSILIGTFLV